MQLDELIDEREPDARSLVTPSLRGLDPVEALEHARQFLGRNAAAAVLNFENGVIPRRVDADRDAALQRELERVGEQVEDDLLPHLAVDEDRRGKLPAFHGEGQSGLLHDRSEGARQIRRDRAEVDGLEFRPHASRLDAREVEQRVDQFQQPQAVAMDDANQLVALRIARRPVHQQVFERPHHQRQRRPELVTHVAEERRLRPVDGGEGFRALPFFLVGARVGQRRRELVGDQVEKAAVVIVERPQRVDADDQASGASARAGRRKRKYLDQFGRRGGQALLGAGRGALQLVIEIGEREGHVRRVRGQRLDRDHARVARRPGRGVSSRKIPEQRQPSLTDDPLRRFGDDAEDPADRAGLDPHRVVRHVEVGFLGKTVAFELEQEIARPECFARPDAPPRGVPAAASPRSRARRRGRAVQGRKGASRQRPADRHRCRDRRSRRPRRE